MLSATFTYRSRSSLVSTRLGRTELSLVLGYISLRSQERGLITLRGPCRLASGHRPKNSDVTVIQDHCEANKTKCLSMEKTNRKGMEQLSVGKWKHTNIPTNAPPSDGGLPGSFIGKARTQYITRGLMVTIYNCVGDSAADCCWVAASPVDKCRPLGYGTVHTYGPPSPHLARLDQIFPHIPDVALMGGFTHAHAPQ